MRGGALSWAVCIISGGGLIFVGSGSDMQVLGIVMGTMSLFVGTGCSFVGSGPHSHVVHFICGWWG